MGDGPGAKALRFLICLLVVILILVYMSPKAC